jgi:branched-subunit amino acid aminotransferase/4-amino-4-deoxychorismate lyase
MVRGAVVELCTRVGIECHTDRPLRLGDLLAAEEVFLTASCSGVRPVCRIERHDVGAGGVGEITGKIMSAYKDLLDQECTADL